MPLQIYFNFDNQALEVMKFYSKVFNTPYEAMFVSEDSTKVLHATMTILDSHVSFSDVPDNYNLIIGNHITLSINTTDLEALKQYYEALSQGGKVLTPLGETFWSPAYGIVIDKFGTTWQLNLDT